MYYRVLVASQRFHGHESLTYSSEDSLTVGQLVRVPLQRQAVVGIVSGSADAPSFATKPISESLPVLVPAEALALLHWLNHYYPSPLGMITELFTPPALPKKLKLSETTSSRPENTHPNARQNNTLPTLTTQQKAAFNAINQKPTGSFLLHGDTGTGKTRLYLELARNTLKAGLSVIILTPEIGLTKPMETIFQGMFGEQVLVTHSEMTPAERRTIWLTLATAERPYVVIGPRSALFAPVCKIGLIVMDEAHDSAYKQEQAPYYQTSRVAAQLAHLHGARFIMGTATPLISDYYMFQEKQLPIIRLTERATAPVITSDTAGITSAEPTLAVTTTIIDQRNKDYFSRSPWLANSLLDAMQHAVEHGEQSMLFLNRRGSARLVLCENCGWQALCPHCDVPLTYHQDQYLMRCHSCDFSGAVPSNCPECNASDLIFRSIGTKALVEIIEKVFPDARVARFDRDTLKADRLQHQFENLQNGEIDIVIGTQAIAKGFDLPKLAVVGVIQADSGLQLPDFNAGERTYQILSQVSGRIGRGHRAGKLFVQTFDPESQLIANALSKNYQAFYERELAERQTFQFPPYYYLLKLTSARANSKSAREAANKVAGSLRQYKHLIVEGPTPRFIEKIAGKYAWHVIVKARQRSYLLDVIKNLPANTYYDLDPSDLL